MRAGSGKELKILLDTSLFDFSAEEMNTGDDEVFRLTRGEKLYRLMVPLKKPKAVDKIS